MSDQFEQHRCSGESGLRCGGVKTHVLVITVNFRAAADVRRLAQEVALQNHSTRLVHLIVDNSPSPDASTGLSDLIQSDGQTRVVTAGSNLGYFGGANWALEQFVRTQGVPRWVVVCNPDISLETADFFDRLLELHTGEEPAVLSPRLISTRNRIRDPMILRRRPSRRQMHFYKWVFRYYATGLVYHQAAHIVKAATRGKIGRLHQHILSDEHPEVIYGPAGAFLLFNRSYFERGGSLDHGTFLFGEEIFVAETVRRMNASVLYDPRLRVRHRGRSTTGYFRNRLIARYLRDSSKYIAEAFFP